MVGANARQRPDNPRDVANGVGIALVQNFNERTLRYFAGSRDANKCHL